MGRCDDSPSVLLLNRLYGAMAAPDMAVLFGPVSQKYTPSAKQKPVRSILFLFLSMLLRGLLVHLLLLLVC